MLELQSSEGLIELEHLLPDFTHVPVGKRSLGFHHMGLSLKTAHNIVS